MIASPPCPGPVLALVVTFNRLAHLKLTLERLLSVDPADLDGVLVVDNASTDGTAEWLAAQDLDRVTVLSLPRNIGGAGGFETGMRHAVAHTQADWLLLMDDDGRPASGTLARFSSIPRGTHEVWATAVYYPQGDICEMNRPWVNPFETLTTFWAALRKGRAGFHIPDSDYSAPAPRDIGGGSFVGLFVSRRAIEMVGYPDGALFLYGDDVLYGLSLQATGARTAFDPELVFEHDCSVDTTVGRAIVPLWKVYYLYRNQLMVYALAAGPWLKWPVFVLKGINWFLAVRHYKGSRRVYFGLWARAMRDGVRGRCGVTHNTVRGWAERR